MSNRLLHIGDYVRAKFRTVTKNGTKQQRNSERISIVEIFLLSESVICCVDGQVRSELTYKEQQEEEMDLLQKRIERERSKAEALQEDITFKTKMGEQWPTFSWGWVKLTNIFKGEKFFWVFREFFYGWWV